MKLADRAALVAGGGQGIGEGIVKCLAEEGANIAVADINGDNAGKVADAVKAMGRKALALTADLTGWSGRLLTFSARLTSWSTVLAVSAGKRWN